MELRSLSGGGWWGCVGVEFRLEPRPVRLAFDDEVEGCVLETIDGALSEEHVVKHGDPLAGVAVAGDDHGGSASALEKELIDVAALFFGHGLEREVVEDEQVDRGKRGHLSVAGVVETALAKELQHGVRPNEADVVAMTARDVTECGSGEGFADADRPKNHDVPMRFEKAQAGELGKHAAVVGDLGGLVEELEGHALVEAGFGSAIVCGGGVTSADLVSNDQEQQVIERHALLVGEDEPI